MPNLVSVSMLAFEKIEFLSFCGNTFRIERVKNESYIKNVSHVRRAGQNLLACQI